MPFAASAPKADVARFANLTPPAVRRDHRRARRGRIRRVEGQEVRPEGPTFHDVRTRGRWRLLDRASYRPPDAGCRSRGVLRVRRVTGAARIRIPGAGPRPED